MSLLFNMLSRLVVTFLTRSKRLLISWLQSPSAVILEPPKIKSDPVSTVSTVSPFISHEVMGSDAMTLVFWMLSFKPIFSLSSFARVQPQWIQGNSKRRQHGEEKLICWKPVWGIPPMTRSWGRKLTYARRAQTSGTPLEIFKHVPQQKSAGFCALLFHSSDIFWKKSIQGFSLLHLKECFNPKTLWWLSSLPAGLVQLCMWLFEASWPQEAQEA